MVYNLTPDCTYYECTYYKVIERDHRNTDICIHPHHKTIEEKISCFDGCPKKLDIYNIDN